MKTVKERFMRNRKSRNVNGVSVRDRMIARIMVLILTVSMMPYQALAAGTAETKRVKSVEDIQTDYEAFMSWRPGLRMKTWSMKICPSHM